MFNHQNKVNAEKQGGLAKNRGGFQVLPREALFSFFL